MFRYSRNPSIFLLLFLFLQNFLRWSSQTLPTVLAADGEISNKEEIVGFWNIYADGIHYKSIIEEQQRVVATSGLLEHLDVLYYTTMGEYGATLTLTPSVADSKLKHLKDFGMHGAEIQTLGLLYDYCNTHPRSKVLYFHNKGSLNYNTMNTNFRRALDCFVLNPQCISALQRGFDTCGWRISPLPHVHYSGNYWWARCDHVNSLIPPTAPVSNRTFIELTKRLYGLSAKTEIMPTPEQPFPDQPYLGLGRYFAETWIGSRPFFKPSDCMNATMNNRYMWGKFPLPWRLVNRKCPNFKEDFMSVTNSHSSVQYHLYGETATAPASAGSVGRKKQLDMHNYLTYGLPCALAGLIAQPKLIQKHFVISIANFTPELRERSLYWYGQEPELHLSWLNMYRT
jgi:hypothetical protein